MMQAKKTFQPVTSNEVCQIYELLLKNNLVSFPITRDGFLKIDSLVANINGTYFDTEIYNSAELKSVAYLYFLIKDHPFTDGNKRTAVLVFSILCELNNLSINRNLNLDEVAVYIEKIQEQD